MVNPESKKKTWEYLSFYGKPVVADLAMIEKFKLDVRDVQAGLLNLSKELVQGFIFTVDSLIAFQAPSAHIVAAGMPFETTIGVGVASKSIRPEFMGSGLRINDGGSTATMTVTANGNVIPEGKSEGIQRYSAMIKVPKADGTFEEIPVSGEFKVRKPEVVVRSKALQLLYKGCGNTVSVDVPDLGESYNPDFSKSTGGRVIKSASNKKDITIVPSAREFKLSVYSKTNGQNVKIDDLKYNVIKPPKPRIVLRDRGREINGMMGLNKRQSYEIKLMADEEFTRTLRKDARYKAKKVKLMYQEGLSPPKTIKSYSGKDIQSGIKVSLYQGAIKQAQPGAKVYFEVEEVSRVNFQGKASSENIGRVELIIPGVIKR